MFAAMPQADVSTKPRWRFRRLRIAVSVFRRGGGGGLCVLWVRSYWWRDEVWRLRSNDLLTTLGSDCGTIFVSHGVTDPLQSLSLQVSERDAWEIGRMESSPKYLGFRRWSYPDKFTIHIPHWFAMLSFAAISVATVPWTRWSFSLRSLLIATTMMAVVLGIGVWLA